MVEQRDIYNKHFINKLAHSIEAAYSSFSKDAFISGVFHEEWHNQSLKERMRHITTMLHKHLALDYHRALAVLYKVAPEFKGQLAGITFPDYVEQYGLNEWEMSMDALAFFTTYSTSEFAVRPFLLKDQKRMMEQFLTWSTHENEHVRRLASEGCRPRLPWGISIPSFKQDPRPVFPVLNNLLQDSSLYVRKSVANNLNDISKTHPDLLLTFTEANLNKHPHTDWILKHACRTLLKNGHPKVLQLFGFDQNHQVTISNFQLSAPETAIGGSLTFQFDLYGETEEKIRIEYAVDYVKSRGNRTRKVFKLAEFQVKKYSSKHYERKLSFKNLSTRTHYSGVHTLTILINGIEMGSLDFHLQ
ncbi:DNA alkylation repair protein [Priestia flexa]|uniref:DNA alkylation repair protein n=1 Tax=Priestia flexa TaxID=86664 RepID=UPI001F4D1E8E|nr:DNA alkylation repair protein [Priestia flexa]